MPATTIRAVLWDFGGVLVSSPFVNFAGYEAEAGLPDGFIRTVNSTNPDTNAWACLERSEVTLEEFADRFEAEAFALGHAVDARRILSMIRGEVRPEMVEALRRCHERVKTALITNNFVTADAARADHDPILRHFDVILESARAGIRKPDPRIYRMACDSLGVEPHEAVFLDDLGVNLKPARAMGMTTIKVVDPSVALAELQEILGFALS